MPCSLADKGCEALDHEDIDDIDEEGPTMDTARKARGAGPWLEQRASMLATVLGVAPIPKPQCPSLSS